MIDSYIIKASLKYFIHFWRKADSLHFEKAAEEELQGVIWATTTKKLAFFVIQDTKTVLSASEAPSWPSCRLSPLAQQQGRQAIKAQDVKTN